MVLMEVRMPIRKDDRYRNLIGGHLRTCTCTECVSRRLGPHTKPKQISKTEYSDQDWQNLVDEISQVDVSNDPQYQHNQSHSVPLSPAEIRERKAKVIEEERNARMERERKAGTRPSPEPTDPKLIQQEEEHKARIKRERQAGTRPSPEPTDPKLIQQEEEHKARIKRERQAGTRPSPESTGSKLIQQEEEHKARIERERQSGTRPSPESTDSKLIQQEEEHKARIERKRQAGTRPASKPTDPTIQSHKSQISWRLFIVVSLFTVVILGPVVLWTLGS